MLRLAHPAPAGQGTDPPKRRRGSRAPALALTPDEVRHLRAAIVATARAYGGFPVLAHVTGIPVQALYKAKRRRPCGVLAIRVAKAAGTPLEAILSGKLTEAGRCTACGSRAAERTQSTATGGA